MRIFALMATKNEADRYLDHALCAVTPAVDDVFVYDDQSSDHTVDVARGHGAHVWVRPDHVPPFLVHEGAFRQGAWDAFCATVGPELGDWILAVDADELLVANGDAGSRLVAAAEQAFRRNKLARLIRIPEIFDVHDGIPQARTDGWWGKIQGSRFFAYQPNGRFTDRAMGSGSEPSYIQSHVGLEVDDLWLLHFGYARFEDRTAKHDRYAGRSGHADAHVASILTEPFLQAWDGPLPASLAWA
jgi:glycosyltransferase involved in cell wall biosynthesis